MTYKLTLAAIAAGFIIDCFLGDPAFIPHPVTFIGRLISLLEKLLRKAFPKTDRGEYSAGMLMAVVVVIITGGVVFGVLFACRLINIWLYFAVCCIMSWQILAARCLRDEAKKVVSALEKEGLPAARKQVGMLVGRDTDELTEEEVIKAAVETVAENTTDGVVAPLFWMLLGGPVGGFMYKAINTMDSMVGYKNDRYMFFGRFAAKLDDVINFIPARIAAAAMIVASAFLGYDSGNAARIWRRDRRNSPSPNSAQTEAVCAGALHVQLGGNAYYFGRLHVKPTQGDPDHPVMKRDVSNASRLMYGASVASLIFFELLGLLAATLGG
ncbi:MAG: cobalamin biosynthesis protein CobD [Oscillospiraceae bacterium]|nr:cobalamin biosynthesis protein CobD [Oscillospiraceae bacterium]